MFGKWRSLELKNCRGQLLPCEWQNIRRSKVMSTVPTRYNICTKIKKNNSQWYPLIQGVSCKLAIPICYRDSTVGYHLVMDCVKVKGLHETIRVLRFLLVSLPQKLLNDGVPLHGAKIIHWHSDMPVDYQCLTFRGSYWTMEFTWAWVERL